MRRFLLVSKFKMIGMILNVVHGRVTVQNNNKKKANENIKQRSLRACLQGERVTLVLG